MAVRLKKKIPPLTQPDMPSEIQMCAKSASCTPNTLPVIHITKLTYLAKINLKLLFTENYGYYNQAVDENIS